MTEAKRQVSLILTDQLGELLTNGTIQQLRAVGERLVQNPDRPDRLVRLCWQPFDLPPRYVQLWFESGFTCGIDDEGRVSS